MYTKKKGLAVLIAAVTGLSSLAVGTVSAAPAAAENAEAVKILSLGDSITDGYWCLSKVYVPRFGTDGLQH